MLVPWRSADEIPSLALPTTCLGDGQQRSMPQLLQRVSREQASSTRSWSLDRSSRWPKSSLLYKHATTHIGRRWGLQHLLCRLTTNPWPNEDLTISLLQIRRWHGHDLVEPLRTRHDLLRKPLGWQDQSPTTLARVRRRGEGKGAGQRWPTPTYRYSTSCDDEWCPCSKSSMPTISSITQNRHLDGSPTSAWYTCRISC